MTKAVESALNQPETAEIILVEDCSPDKTLEVCRALQSRYEKVKLYRHPDKKNHGAGASRNLGIEKAIYDYVAFLDADDYYLPKRFRAEIGIFAANRDVDGVYGALGFKYYSERAGSLLESPVSMKQLTTISVLVEPENLLEVLVKGTPKAKGSIHLDCLTVRRSVFGKCGMFNCDLRLSQDSDLLFKMAASSVLMPGIIDEPIAIRGIHESNRVSDQKSLDFYKAKLYESFYNWGKTKKISRKILREVHNRFLVWNRIHNSLLTNIFFLINSPIFHRDIFYRSRFFNPAVNLTFGNNVLSAFIIRFKEKLQLISTKESIR